MSRIFSRSAFLFVFLGLFLLIPPFTEAAIAFLNNWTFIFIGFFLYMIGAVLASVSVIKKERGVLTIVNLIGVLMGIVFLGMLTMSNESLIK